LSLYLDTSVLVALFIQEAATPIARAGVAGQVVMVSNFAAAEFSAAISRRNRVGELSEGQVHQLFADFDLWTARGAHWIDAEPSDIALAIALVRRLELGLRAPDALHLAICQRAGQALFTFDLKMASAAPTLGIKVHP
jgi:predicted nucleic acid-binding protein